MGLWMVSGAASAQAGVALEAPEVPPAPTGSPADWTSPSVGRAAPRPLSPNGPAILRLRRDIRQEQAELDSIDVGLPIGLFIGGLVVTGVGGITALMYGPTANIDVAIGGLIAAGAGLVTWVTSLIVWRVLARQRRAHQERIEQYEGQLRMLLGAPPAFRF